jgi:hypothetical protein
MRNFMKCYGEVLWETRGFAFLIIFVLIVCIILECIYPDWSGHVTISNH